MILPREGKALKVAGEAFWIGKGSDYWCLKVDSDNGETIAKAVI